MKIQDIKKFYQVLNTFLKNNQSSAMIGMPYLNPNFPRSISVDKKKDFNFFKKFMNYFLRLIFYKNNYNSFSNHRYKHLILSHFVSYDHLNYSNDFYFGELGKKLNYKDVLFVLIDHIGFDKKKIKKKIKGNYIILSRTLNPLLEIKLIIVTLSKVIFYNVFNRNLKLFNLSNIFGSLDNQRISIQVKKIFNNYNFRNIFFTFEGNPYEKLICNEIFRSYKKIKRIAYQFSVLRKFQNSIYSFIDKGFDPDIILTVGKYNKKLLFSKFKKRSKIYNFGLFKKKKIISKNLVTKKKKFQILVMPEGIPSEINLFLDYCLKNQNNQIQFNFRLHPIFSSNKIFLKKINNKSSNIKISKNKLDKDIKNNTFLVYRGSAAVIDVVKSGLIPIYLKEKNELSIDPLFKENKKHSINFDRNLLHFLKEDYKNQNFKKELIRIQKFTKSFYDKPKFSKLIKILRENII